MKTKVSYWIFITSRETFLQLINLPKPNWQLPRRSIIEAMQKGDIVVFYIAGKGASYLSQEAKIVSEPHDPTRKELGKKPLGSDRIEVDLNDIDNWAGEKIDLKLRVVREKLDFIKNKKYWMLTFHQPVIRIEEEHYKAIKSLLPVGNQAETEVKSPKGELRHYIQPIMERNTKSVIIANITWNSDGWRNSYVNSQAGARYVRETPGHESLNFKFDKPIDKDGKVHGYVHWTHPPKDFQSGGIVIFYSRNLKTNEGEIVGVYGDAEVVREPITTQYFGFEKNTLLANIITKECFSMLFPAPLNEKKYKKMLETKRLVPQVGFRWIEDASITRHIIRDEIVALKRSGIRQDELKKLVSIYEHVTGEVYKEGLYAEDDDIKEQDEIVEVLQKTDRKDEIIQDLRNLKPTDPEVVKFEGKTYKRDNKTIAGLKILRDSKCQICGQRILKKNGDFYVEAAHIIPKCRKGVETPDNILILCPNHHKEFDLGKKEIITHSMNFIKFVLNGIKHILDLSF